MKHHQQASDFIKTKKYRNQNFLMTCADCHDPHGYSGLPHQLTQPLDSPRDGAKLCLSCHNATFAQGANVGARMQAHWKGKGLADVAMGQGVRCIDCHNSLTAKSGAGRASFC